MVGVVELKRDGRLDMLYVRKDAVGRGLTVLLINGLDAAEGGRYEQEPG